MVCLGWRLALLGQLLLVFAIVALSGPGRIDIVDGQTRYEVARSLVDHGDSVIRDEAAWFAVFKGRDGQKYTNYRLPQSALGVGAIALADATGPVSEVRRQFFFTLISPLMAALLAGLYTLWFRHQGHSPGASLAWGTAGVFCTPSWYYGTSTFDDILGTFAVVLAVTAMWQLRHRAMLLGAVVAGVALAWAVNCKPPLAIFVLPVLAIAYRPDGSWRRQLVPAALVCLLLATGVGFCKAYDAYKFPPGTEHVFEEYFKQNGSWFTLNPLPGLAGLAVSASCGALWYCPTLFLSWRGWQVWRDRERLYCRALVVASLLFTLSLCFLPFFKGEPCWGPRYLTPVFALWWLFVPAALERVTVSKARFVLGLGVTVQMLGLSVDPMRLFVQVPLRWNYYNQQPWLGFDGTISHLVQRPREIVEVLTPREQRAPEFNHGPLPTHAGCLSTAPQFMTHLAGLGATPLGPSGLNVATSIGPTSNAQAPVVTRQALDRYHIYNAPRPWVFNQWYLAEDARPVDLRATIALLAVVCGVGLGLTVLGLRVSSKIGQMGSISPIGPISPILQSSSAFAPPPNVT